MPVCPSLKMLLSPIINFASPDIEIYPSFSYTLILSSKTTVESSPKFSVKLFQVLVQQKSEGA